MKLSFDFSSITIYLVIGTIAIALMPASPFSAFIDVIGNIPYLSWLNWFLPISEMLAIGQAWLGAITLYYVVSMLLRWIKIIS